MAVGGLADLTMIVRDIISAAYPNMTVTRRTPLSHSSSNRRRPSRNVDLEAKFSFQSIYVVDIVKVMLEKAKEMCGHGFENADKLLEAVEESIRLLRKEWYEEITAEEVAAIKAAMVSGPGGIATHSGHWYNCANGHPPSPRTH